jgi:hypothetical protein
MSNRIRTFSAPISSTVASAVNVKNLGKKNMTMFSLFTFFFLVTFSFPSRF